MEDIRKAFCALGNGTRLRLIVSLLDSGEATVGEIAQHHSMHRTTVSRHLGQLENAGLVRTRRNGTFVYYSPELGSPSVAIQSILRLIQQSPKRRIK